MTNYKQSEKAPSGSSVGVRGRMEGPGGGVRMRSGLRPMRGRQGRLWEEETPFAPGALAWRSS